MIFVLKHGKFEHVNLQSITDYNEGDTPNHKLAGGDEGNLWQGADGCEHVDPISFVDYDTRDTLDIEVDKVGKSDHSSTTEGAWEEFTDGSQ